MLRALGTHSGACELVISDDVSQLFPGQIETYDAIILNNTCSHGHARNLFRDILVTDAKTCAPKHADLPEATRTHMADEVTQAVMDFVASGKGLMVMHGALVAMNKTEAFAEMLGGRFAYHLRPETLTLHPVEPDHPLLQAFEGQPFIHHDEPYLFDMFPDKAPVRPLLRLDVASLNPDKRGKPDAHASWAAWIKPHGQGRVFYVSPSHFKDSYLDSRLLQFYLDGLQYVLGDLTCDDTPLE